MVKTRMLQMVVVLLLALAWAPRLWAEIEVTIDRNPVQVNESFQLVFSLDQSPDRDPDFSGLQQHFLILGSNSSSTISIINGEYRRSIKYTLQLMPKQVGEFMIPAIRFDKERSKPFQVTVKPSSLSAVPQDKLVLEVMADKNEVYVQSQVILTLRLLSAVNISDYQFGNIDIGSLDAVIEPLGKVREYQTRIADVTYLVLEKRFALFPQQSGRLEVNPLMAEVRLRSRQTFDPFRSGGKVRRLRSQPVYIDVEPIPADFRAPHWLPANRLELREDWQGDLNALVAGEPITRSLTLVADGLTAAQLPELSLPPIDGIKQYPDQPALDNSLTSSGIRGERLQKVALIPGAEGVYRLPPIELFWWNLETGKVEVATIPGRELIVEAAQAAPAGVATEVAESAPVTAPSVPRANPFWLWLSLFLGCGWSLTALYWWLVARRPAAPAAAPAEHPSLRQARRELQRACQAADAAGARRALLAWGQALLAPREIHNLHQLCVAFGAELTHQVNLINTSLYAKPDTPWHGDDLLRLCQRLEQQGQPDSSTTSGLLPLNPTG
ncbi:MAG: protein BatD [Gammaproteobacteria bacterium]|nr:MAG: protein BatD [Gammaproteobacteria bacterium]